MKKGTSGKRPSASVPHHWVGRRLHEQAAKRAERRGVSLSRVISTGLDDWLDENATPAQIRRLKEESRRLPAETGLRRNPGPMVALPVKTARQLQDMLEYRDPQLNNYLWGLWEAGWPYASLAEATGRTKAAMQQRVNRAREQSEKGIPGVEGLPEPPIRGDAFRDTSFCVDMAFWPADRETYELVALRAREMDLQMWQVIETILGWWLSGQLDD